MRRGRLKKTTAVHELNGNPGHREHNSSEPRPKISAPKCPRHITGAARAEWNRICKHLKKLGIITLLDRVAIAGYSTAWGHFIEAERMIAEKGHLVKDAKGNAVPNPYMKIWEKSAVLMLRFGAELGLTPSSRTRIHARPEGDAIEPTAEQKKFAELQAQLFTPKRA